MLVDLHVKNLALIEEADINFEKGLNILTGETGAGKSIMLGSINIALGGKVPTDFIRQGAEYGLVELTFKESNKDKIQELKALDVAEVDDGDIIITRKIMPTRSVIKVNGETKTVSEVKAITSRLIDIHGQHEHQSLLYKANYLKIIDQYASAELSAFFEALGKQYAEYKECRSHYEEYNLDQEGINRELSFIEYEINEIETAALKENEDEELEALYKKFNNSKKIMEEMSAAKEFLSGEGTENATDFIERAVRSVTNVLSYDSALDNICRQLRDIEDIVNSVNQDIAEYIMDAEYDEETYTQVFERLTLINNLKSKYGNTIEEIFRYYENRKERYQKLSEYEENKAAAREALEKAQKKCLDLCKKLSKARKEAAKVLSEAIKKALLELNFNDVSFTIDIEEKDTFNERGYNEAEFMISTNTGEALKPLSKVASGGELSRIMLAIKTVLADKDDIETLIFDEIDTGISGRTAQQVSVKLNEITRARQVICITHLPQIASMADEHFVIEKNVSEGKTHTTIRKLTEEESVSELARLLGGVEITEAVMSNAKEMKQLATTAKSSINEIGK